MIENGKTQRKIFYLKIMRWIQEEVDVLIKLYQDPAMDDLGKQRFMARISELGAVRVAIMNIFWEDGNND